LRGVLSGKTGMKELADTLASRRAAAFNRAKAAVDSPRYRSLLLDTLQWLENGDWAKHRRRQGGPIERFAAKVLARRTKKAKKKAGKLRKLDPRQRHKLRIAVKSCAMAAISSKICSSAAKRESVCHASRIA
jgi:triphosphatase